MLAGAERTEVALQDSVDYAPPGSTAATDGEAP